MSESQLNDTPLAEEWEANSNAAGILDCCRFAEPDDVATLVELIAADPVLCDCQDDLGRTPLHMAAANGHAHVIATLLTMFNPLRNRQNHEGNTALHYAALDNHVECARLLLDAGWKVSVRNRYGRTALQDISDRQFEDLEVLLLKHDDELDTYANAAATMDISPAEGAGGDDVARAEQEPEAATAQPLSEPAALSQEKQGGALDELE